MCLRPLSDYSNPEKTANGPIYRYKVVTKEKRLLRSYLADSVIWEHEKWIESQDLSSIHWFDRSLSVDLGFHVYLTDDDAKRQIKHYTMPDRFLRVIKIEVKGFIAGGLFEIYPSETWKQAKLVEVYES